MTENRDGLIHYPFPLRPGVFVYLYLPRDLTKDDVRRLTDLLQSIVPDPKEDIPR
jgi:hypothetical protein